MHGLTLALTYLHLIPRCILFSHNYVLHILLQTRLVKEKAAVGQITDRNIVGIFLFNFT